MTERATLGPCSPLFIAANLQASLDHYLTHLGFECRFRSTYPKLFAIVGRNQAQIMLKVIGDQVPPLPNPQRHDWARWDAFVYSPDPDRLAQEFSGRDVIFRQPLRDTDDRLRGFEVADPDGYICFFGRPIDG
ncbi:MAG: hypothetical protein ACFB6S_09530 [Geminicoccaceae bacterium]